MIKNEQAGAEQCQAQLKLGLAMQKTLLPSPPPLVRLPDPCYSLQSLLNKSMNQDQDKERRSCNMGQVRQGVSTGDWKRRKLVLEAGESWHLLVAKIGVPWPSSCSGVVFGWAQWCGRSLEWSIFCLLSLILTFLFWSSFFSRFERFPFTIYSEFKIWEYSQIFF